MMYKDDSKAVGVWKARWDGEGDQ